MKKLSSLLLVMSVVLMCFGSVSLVAFANGTVTIDGVTYETISSATEFSSKISADPAGNYALIADITLDQTNGAYTPIETFSGTLVGANGTALETRTITINVDTDTVGVGLFTTINGATFKNIKTAGSINISDTTGAIGAFAGTAKTTECKFIDCENNTFITVDGYNTTRLGGFVGLVSKKTTFENCFNTGNITATGTPGNFHVGGFAGDINGGSLVANNCINRATIAGGGNVGGFVGNTSKTVTLTNFANTGDITGYISVGGFIGKTSAASNISKSYNTGNIHQSNARSGSTTTYAGALVGNASGNTMTVENCYSGGTVTEDEKTTHTTTLGKIATLSSSAAATLSNTYTINENNIDFLTKASGATGGIQMTNCYYLADTTGEESNGLTPLSDTDMKKQESFGFDFIGTWTMGNASQNYYYPQINGNEYIKEISYGVSAPTMYDASLNKTDDSTFFANIDENAGNGKYTKLIFNKFHGIGNGTGKFGFVLSSDNTFGNADDKFIEVTSSATGIYFYSENEGTYYVGAVIYDANNNILAKSDALTEFSLTEVVSE